MRGLQPEFQNPVTQTTESLSKQELLAQVHQALEGDFAEDVEFRPKGKQVMRAVSSML